MLNVIYLKRVGQLLSVFLVVLLVLRFYLPDLYRTCYVPGTIPSTLKTSFKTHCDPLREVLLSILLDEEYSEVKPGSDKDGL